MTALQWQLPRCARRRSAGRRAVSADALLAVAVASAAGLAAGFAGPALPVVRAGAVLAAGGYLALACRRRHPLAVLAVVLAAVLVGEAATPRLGAVTQFLALLIVTYSLGAHAPTRALAGGLVMAAVGVALAVVFGPPSRYSVASTLPFFISLFVLAPALLGRLIRARSQLADRLRETTERLRAAREVRVAASLAQERARIAGELETVVLRGLEAMREHAEAQSLRAVTALERVARETLGQMRRLLVELRSGSDSPPSERSLPELRARVEQALAAEPALPGAGEAAPAPARWMLVSPRWIDAALAVIAIGFAAALAATTLSRTGLHGTRVLDALLAAAIPIALAWVRTRPLAATAVAFAIAIAYARIAAPPDPLGGPDDLAVLPGLAIGARCDLRRALAGLGLCGAGTAAVLLLDPAAPSSPIDAGLFAALLVGGWTFGRAVHEGGRLLGTLAETVVALEHERHTQALASMAKERSRVARELHDAVAHSMTVVVLHATAARRVWHSDPVRAREHTSVLRETAAESLDGLRELAVSLALGASEAHVGLDRLHELVATARSAGLRVELRIEGQAAPVADEIQRAAYRIVQEALTNAARHAPGAHMLVWISHGSSGVVLDLENGPPPWPSARIAGAGHGLLGMRERALACGGELRAGPRPDGGFAIHAHLVQVAPVR